MTLTALAHPLLALVDRLGHALDEASQVQPTYLDTAEKAAALRHLAVVETRVAELRLRILAVADDVAESDATRDVATWLVHQTHCEPGVARADTRLAEALDRRWTRLATALAAGELSLEQARVVSEALEALPGDVDAATVDQAESTLIAYARTFRPSQLRRLGRRILDVVAPEVGEAVEARRLAELERDADRATRLHLRELGDGTTRLSGVLPDAAAARLRTYLESFTSPRRESSAGALPGLIPEAAAPEVARLPYARRLGLAFCALLEHLDPRQLPAHGGDATTVIVTVGLDQLRSELGTADLLDLEHGDGATGATLTAAQARRLACTARIIPAVLGGDSEILDLGRASRLFSPAQRKALRLRDRRCRAEGCSTPATWCEAHHLHPWSTGGRTDLADGILLCHFHHQRAHDPRDAAERRSDGDIRFVRRT